MSASMYRGQLDRKRKQRIDAEKKASEFRTRESGRRTDANKARTAAAKSRSDSTVRSKLREADRRENEAAAAGKEANRWAAKAAAYSKDESALQEKLHKAEQSEATSAERRRARDQKQVERRAASDRSALVTRVVRAESALSQIYRDLPTPKPENLRVLILGASADGDLRVGREQKRIRMAVESALHRDRIDLDVRPAATTQDLLDGITRFRPHVIHFSGHSDAQFIEFEDEVDAQHDGVLVTATAFARAIQATDTPPMLLLLNSCNSAAQIYELVAEVCPLAIGMADEIDDGDAINYAAQFYAAVANGQSVKAAHNAGRSALELAGLDGAELPTLAAAVGIDPSKVVLVEPTG